MRKVIISFIALALFGLLTVGYTQTMALIGSGFPPEMAEPSKQAHTVLVIKSTRELHLLQNGQTIRNYDISLGGSPEGHKQAEGDERTPEGHYVIDWRNENSIAHLSLHISYPNEADLARASEAGASAGGNIMIHGLPNGWGFLGRLHLVWDWTNGCIALTNAEMREIWSLVPNGTPIKIVEAI